MDQAGQQLVPIQSIFSGTSRKKSLASSTVHRSAPMATSTTSAKPRVRMAVFSLAGVASGPYCPHKCGSHAGDDLFTTLDGLDQLEDLALVGDGGEVHFTRGNMHAGDALIAAPILARPSSSDSMASMPQAAQGAPPGDRPGSALVKALAALDTLALINVAALVFIQIDGVLGADVHAGWEMQPWQRRHFFDLPEGRRCRHRG